MSEVGSVRMSQVGSARNSSLSTISTYGLLFILVAMSELQPW